MPRSCCSVRRADRDLLPSRSLLAARPRPPAGCYAAATVAPVVIAMCASRPWPERPVQCRPSRPRPAETPKRARTSWRRTPLRPRCPLRRYVPGRTMCGHWREEQRFGHGLAAGWPRDGRVTLSISLHVAMCAALRWDSQRRTASAADRRCYQVQVALLGPNSTIRPLAASYTMLARGCGGGAAALVRESHVFPSHVQVSPSGESKSTTPGT